MDCINLKQRFGGRFKVEYGEGYHAQYGPNARIEDPWYLILLCRHGHIYPYGGETLAASTDHRGPVAKRLIDLDCTAIGQDGDDGITVTFDVSEFDRVAEIMKPLKARPRLSEKHRARLLAAGREHRFSAGSRSPENAQESRPASMPV